MVSRYVTQLFQGTTLCHEMFQRTIFCGFRMKSNFFVQLKKAAYTIASFTQLQRFLGGM